PAAAVAAERRRAAARSPGTRPGPARCRPPGTPDVPFSWVLLLVDRTRDRHRLQGRRRRVTGEELENDVEGSHHLWRPPCRGIYSAPERSSRPHLPSPAMCSTTRLLNIEIKRCAL